MIRIKKLLIEANFISHKISVEKYGSFKALSSVEIGNSFYFFENLVKRTMNSFDDSELIEISIEILVSSFNFFNLLFFCNLICFKILKIIRLL